MDLNEKINLLSKTPHCQNCGILNPECYPGFEYTVCCNEDVCDCLEKHIFYNAEISVKACCWAHAETLLHLKGIDIMQQSGMTRLPLNDIDQN